MRSNILKHTSSVMRFTVLAVCLASGLTAGEARSDYRNLTGFPKEELSPLVVERVWPKEAGEAAICLWKEDKTVAFSVTIDDNIKSDQAWWLEQGKKYGFRFTWFVIVNNLVKGAQNAGTWSDFQGLLKAGHDVQSHTWSHRSKEMNLSAEEDYSKALPLLTEKLKDTKPLTLAYAGGGLPNDPSAAVPFYAGARGGIGTTNGPRTDWLNVNSVSGGANYNIPARTKGDWASLLPLLDPKSKNYRGWLCTHFHWMGPKADKTRLVTSMPDTIGLFDFIKERESEIWVGLFREVILYGQERDTAKLQVIKNTPENISLVLTDRMYDEWYDFPLTVKVCIPENWKALTAVQGGKTLKAVILAHEGKSYALVDIVPDKGEALISQK